MDNGTANDLPVLISKCPAGSGVPSITRIGSPESQYGLQVSGDLLRKGESSDLKCGDEIIFNSTFTLQFGCSHPRCESCSTRDYETGQTIRHARDISNDAMMNDDTGERGERIHNEDCPGWPGTSALSTNTDNEMFRRSRSQYDAGGEPLVTETEFSPKLNALRRHQLYRNENEHVEWLEARISHLELKLKDMNNLESGLEALQQENETLRGQLTELKRTVASLEVMELEFRTLQEMVKYREEDKRCKDALERSNDNLRAKIEKLESTIHDLRAEVEKLSSDVSDLRYENEKLSSTVETVCNENIALKQERRELDLKENVARCSENKAVTSEFCCDMVREIKSSLIDLVEREFNCSICGDLFVEATVTNCNHVFCSYCLTEWKKKKKQCPFCRAILTRESKAVVIDEYITNLSKILSETMFNDRQRIIEERRVADVPPPPKRPRNRSSRVRSITGPIIVD